MASCRMSYGCWLTAIDIKAMIRLRRAVSRPSTYNEQTLIDNNFEPNNGTIGEQLDLSSRFIF